MVESIGGVPVEVLTYEDLIDQIRSEYDMSLTSVIDTLAHWGVNIVGIYRAYWPADSFVVADSISLEVAREVERLLGDPRLKVNWEVPGATFELGNVRRKDTNEFASDARIINRRPYKRDHYVGLRFTTTQAQSGGDLDFDQDDLRLPKLYITGPQKGL